MLDPPAPLLDPPEPIVDGSAPRLDAPPPLLDAPDDDLLVDAPAPRLEPPAELADAVPGATVEDHDLWAPPDSSADDFWASAEPVAPTAAEAERESPALAPSEAAPPTAALGVDRLPPPARDGVTDSALQEAGLAGPLNTAMGDLRRLYPPDGHPDALPPVVASPPVYPSISPSRHHRSGARAWWASRGRELVPGVAVAFVVVLAFAVVLLGRGGDDETSRTDTQSPTTLASATTTVPGAADLSTVVPPPEEPPPAEPGADTQGVGSAPALVSPPSTAQSRPRATRATPSPAPAPRPTPTAAPTTPPPAPATTQPPATTAPPTTRVPDPPDPCDRLFSPEARQKCLEGLGDDD